MIINLHQLKKEQATNFWQLAFRDPTPEWKQWDGPYFDDQFLSLEEFLKIQYYFENPLFQVITVDGQMSGCVSAYYEDGDLKRWLEIGIVIYQSKQWQKGIGKQALTQWINQLWKITDLPHIGLTTWSGNTRMIHLAQSLGMKEEACVRKVRYWQDQYWDSVKYGILREEWK